MAKATFGAGCFWGPEAAFRRVPGVIGTAVGYAGGTKANPSYQEVCAGTTGHAEVVQVEFDPGVISYQQLLEQFWDMHDPTQLNCQGPDVGTQYRSVILYHDGDQKAAAERTRAERQASGRYAEPIVTEIVPTGDFWMAEEYHQQFFEKRGIAVGH